jgi:hypothetical protein
MKVDLCLTNKIELQDNSVLYSTMYNTLFNIYMPLAWGLREGHREVLQWLRTLEFNM